MTQLFQSGATLRLGQSGGGSATKFFPATNNQNVSANSFWFLDESVSVINFPDISSTEVGDFIALMTSYGNGSIRDEDLGGVNLRCNDPIELNGVFYRASDLMFGGSIVFYNNGEFWQNSASPFNLGETVDITSSSSSLTKEALGWDGVGSIKLLIQTTGGGGSGAKVLSSFSPPNFAGGAGASSVAIFETNVLSEAELNLISFDIGAGGIGRTSVNNIEGADGGDTTISYDGNLFLTCSGGLAGTFRTGSIPRAGNASVVIGTSPILERVAFSQEGFGYENVNGNNRGADSAGFAGGGGASYFSNGANASTSTSSPAKPGFGAGGGGVRSSSSATLSGPGGDGFLRITWVVVE